MGLIRVDDDVPGKTYWKCEDCPWESGLFPRKEQQPIPVHDCKIGEKIQPPKDKE